jgi:hypothetical protein
MLTKEAWESVFEEVEERRKAERDMLEGGSCFEPHMYGERVGFLKGLKFFEERIAEARKRSQRNYKPETEED